MGLLHSPRPLLINTPLFTMYIWFGSAVTAFVTSTKLFYVEPGKYWDW